MLRRAQFHSKAFLVAAAVAAGAMALSCGGGPERDTVAGPAPAVAQAPAPDQGTVGASATPDKVTICHYDLTTTPPTPYTPYTLSLTKQGAAAHVPSLGGKHPLDTPGACPPCPCFDASIQPGSCQGSFACDSASGAYWFPGDPSSCYQYATGTNSYGAYYCTGAAGTKGITAAEYEACRAILVPLLRYYYSLPAANCS